MEGCKKLKTPNCNAFQNLTFFFIRLLIKSGCFKGKSMHKTNKKRPICPYCGSKEFVILNGTKNKQAECTRCKKYFKEGSKRSFHNKDTNFVLNLLSSLVFSPAIKEINTKEFAKKIKNSKASTIQSAIIEYNTRNNNPNRYESVVDIDGTIKNCVLLARTSTGFMVVRDFKDRKTIRFKDINLKLEKKSKRR